MKHSVKQNPSLIWGGGLWRLFMVNARNELNKSKYEST